MAASETKLGPEVEQVLRQRAMSIVLAGGFMVLITDEPAVAKVLQNELLLLTYNLVLTLDVPVALWTKRACKEKLLAMLLASALRLGELDLNYAEAEGRRLVELAKAAQLIVKAKEKALRAAKAKASKEGSTSKEAEIQESLQLFLQQPCPTAFKAIPPLPEAAPPQPLQLTDSELMPPPPPLLPPPPSPPRPPPVSVPEEISEEEDLKWMQCYESFLDGKQIDLELREQELERRAQLFERDWHAELIRKSKRDVREHFLLVKEISSLEGELEEIDSRSSCKRLRAERNELREELSREEVMSKHLARVGDRLRAERDHAWAQLEIAQADIDDLLEFKASTCLEAQRRLMCPRISE